MTNLDFSVLNAPDQTFEGTELYRLGEYGGENYNLSVDEDISGNVPLGEQYNDFTFFHDFGRLGRGLQRHRRDAGGFLDHAVR